MGKSVNMISISYLTIILLRTNMLANLKCFILTLLSLIAHNNFLLIP